MLPGQRAARVWLDRAPVTDPVDRINSRFIQVLMIALGVQALLVRLYFMAADPAAALPAHWTVAAITNLASDASIMLAAWLGVLVIRRGHFHRGIQWFVCIYLLTLAANYLAIGYRQAPPDPTPALLLAISGVVLGPRTLWTVYAAVLFCFGLGQLADALWLPHAPSNLWWAFHALPLQASAYLMMAFAIDRTTRALRQLLAHATQHGEALALSNLRLQQEMTEREHTRHQLIHSQKLDAIGRAASGVAHDFGNMLNVVLGYASQREQLADIGKPALVEAMHGIEQAAVRALALSRKLLNFSRAEASPGEVFDACTALSELQPMLRQLLGHEIRLSLALPPVASPLRLDRGQFELVILNLATNARDAMPGGGEFNVQLQHAGAPPMLRLSLADTGSGMDEQVRAQVFEPFYTTKPAGCGTGLGLSVAANIVQAAQGHISVHSDAGRGSCFTIHLPLDTATQASPANR